MSKYSNPGTTCRPLALITAMGAGLAANGLQAASIHVTSTADAPINTVTQDCLLRDALATAANAVDQGGCTLIGDPGSEAMLIDLSELSGDLQLEHGQLDYPAGDRTLSLVGPGKDTLTLRADTQSRVMDFDGDVNDFRLVLQGLGFQDGDADGDGGAIRFRGRELSLVDVRISNSQASGEGGGLRAHLEVDEINSLPDRQTLGMTIEASEITGNHAGDNGGGLYAYVYALESSGTDMHFTLTDSIIENNSSDGLRGGGVGVFMQSKYGSEDSIETLVEGNHFANNQASTWGGGLDLNISPKETDVEEIDISIRGNHFQYNETNQDGGGLGVRLNWVDGRLVTARSHANIDLEDNHFENNKARGTGGGAYVIASISKEESPELDIVSHENTFVDNQSSVGGGLWISGSMRDNRPFYPFLGSVDITSKNDFFANNSADFPEQSVFRGGAAYFRMRNRDSNETAAAGPTRLVIENATVIDHYSKNDAGGIWAKAEQFEGSEFLIHGSTLAGNHAEEEGGALVVDGFEQIDLLNSTISSNQAGGNGGGLLITDSEEVSLQHATIVDNETGGSGGGLHVSGAGAIAIDHVILAGNLAQTNGPELENTDSAAANVRFSLVEDASDASFNDLEGNIFAQAHQLAPLADNGGPSPTRQPAPDSPVINSGNPGLGAGAPDYDQRGPGFPRVVGPAPNIGAIEILRIFSDSFEDQSP